MTCVESITLIINLNFNVNPIQDGRQRGPRSPPPTSFPPVTFAKVGLSTQIFLTFSFSSFSKMM